MRPTELPSALSQPVVSSITICRDHPSGALADDLLSITGSSPGQHFDWSEFNNMINLCCWFEPAAMTWMTRLSAAQAACGPLL